MRNTILTAIWLLFPPVMASAQFHTITREMGIGPGNEGKVEVTSSEGNETTEGSRSDTFSLKAGTTGRKVPRVREDDKGTNLPVKGDSIGKYESLSVMAEHKEDRLPLLTIPNLYAEIKRNRIKFPKIVLAQAILETGWFQSPTCRYRHNLFGLTNPETGGYYEFGHWTDSVRAYYTKVQYRYKGGNYLQWLKDIGYAEDKNYVRAIVSVLEML